MIEDSETVFVIIVALLDAELCGFFLSCLARNALYKRVCLSIHPSVDLFLHWLVGWSLSLSRLFIFDSIEVL